MATIVEKTRPDGSKYWVSKTEGKYQIEFEEDFDAYQEDWQPGDRSCTRILRCAWDERSKFQYDLIGGATRGNDGLIIRDLPERHPDIDRMYCVAARLIKGKGRPDIDRTTTLPRFLNEGFPPPRLVNDHPDLDTTTPGQQDYGRSTTPVYGKAEFVTQWKVLPYPILTDQEVQDLQSSSGLTYGGEYNRYVWQLQTYAAETVGRPGNTFKWVTVPKDPIPIGLQKPLHTKEVTLIWYRVPVVPDAAIEAAIGKVNSTPFAVCDNNVCDVYEPGTLLFMAPDKVQDPADFLWTITYKFQYRRDGWNKYFRAALAAFDDFSVDGTTATTDGNRLHDSIDFMTLFSIP